MPRRRKQSFLYRHSLSFVAIGLLIVWIIGYRLFHPKTHLGAFFGNAIAHWSGSVVIILGTKFLYEVGSAESRLVKGKERFAWLNILHRHSADLYHRDRHWLDHFISTNERRQQMGPGRGQHRVRMGSDGRLGVFLTKRLVEIGSWESSSTALVISCFAHADYPFFTANLTSSPADLSPPADRLRSMIKKALRLSAERFYVAQRRVTQ